MVLAEVSSYWQRTQHTARHHQSSVITYRSARAARQSSKGKLRTTGESLKKVGRQVKRRELNFPGYAGSLPAKSAASRCCWREAQVALTIFSCARGLVAEQPAYLRSQVHPLLTKLVQSGKIKIAKDKITLTKNHRQIPSTLLSWQT